MTDFEHLRAEFDLWLAEWTRQQREEAWAQGHHTGRWDAFYANPTQNPYRKD